MSKVRVIEDKHQKLVCVHCPGCGIWHPFRVRGSGPKWGWNDDSERPTFTPSMLVNKSIPEARCHSFVTDGEIRFLGDCFHDLKNQTVKLPELDADGLPVHVSDEEASNE